MYLKLLQDEQREEEKLAIHPIEMASNKDKKFLSLPIVLYANQLWLHIA